MKYLKAILSIGIFAFSTLAAASPVEIRVHGLRSDQGSILINLFVSAETWSTEVPDKVLQISPLSGTTAVAALDLPPGHYAFFLFHDEDGDGQLKRGAFGLPAEPYAFSNNVHIHLSKPSFQKLNFAVTETGAVQEIQLVNP